MIAHCIQNRLDDESSLRMMPPILNDTYLNMHSELPDLTRLLIRPVVAKRPSFSSYVSSVSSVESKPGTTRMNAGSRTTPFSGRSAIHQQPLLQPPVVRTRSSSIDKHREQLEEASTASATVGIERKVPLSRPSKLGAIAQRSLVSTTSSISADTTKEVKRTSLSIQQVTQPTKQHSINVPSYRLPLKPSSNCHHRSRSNSPALSSVGSSQVGRTKLSPRLRAVQQSLSIEPSSSFVPVSGDGQSHRRQSRPRSTVDTYSSVASSSEGGAPTCSSITHGDISPIKDEFDTLLDHTLLELGIAYSKLH